MKQASKIAFESFKAAFTSPKFLSLLADNGHYMMWVNL